MAVKTGADGGIYERSVLRADDKARRDPLPGNGNANGTAEFDLHRDRS